MFYFEAVISLHTIWTVTCLDNVFFKDLEIYNYLMRVNRVQVAENMVENCNWSV